MKYRIKLMSSTGVTYYLTPEACEIGKKTSESIFPDRGTAILRLAEVAGSRWVEDAVFVRIKPRKPREKCGECGRTKKRSA